MERIEKNEKINLTIPKKSEYMSTVRLTTSALSNLIAFDIDEIEDIKVITSEVCTFFINNIKNKSEPLTIEYNLSHDKITVEVKDLNSGEISEEGKKNSEMNVLIIESLADSYNFDLENKKITFERARI